jgi:hypothetical protein
MSDLFGYSHYERLSRSAEISECSKYRYWLCRSWKVGGNGKAVCFVMLNPSTADALLDDATIRRCMGFTRTWGYSTLDVRNLFALRATDPRELLLAEDPVGPVGDANLAVARGADLVIAAWGTQVPFSRDQRALELLAGKPLYCLGLTARGYPRHPLYVKADQQPILWKESTIDRGVMHE